MGESQTSKAPASRNIFSMLAALISYLLIFLVHIYRATLGKLIGGYCRFTPSCSQYMIDAINRYGPIKGSFRGVRRICRCHPGKPGGDDPA